MKRVILLLSFILVCIFLFAQDQHTASDNKGLARTYKRKGVEIYILSEPIRDYTVTGTVSDEDAESIINIFAGKETKRTLVESIDVLISNANRKAGKKKFEFDAIITEDGSTGTCIKFKE